MSCRLRRATRSWPAALRAGCAHTLRRRRRNPPRTTQWSSGEASVVGLMKLVAQPLSWVLDRRHPNVSAEFGPTHVNAIRAAVPYDHGGYPHGRPGPVRPLVGATASLAKTRQPAVS